MTLATTVHAYVLSLAFLATLGHALGAGEEEVCTTPVDIRRSQDTAWASAAEAKKGYMGQSMLQAKSQIGTQSSAGSQGAAHTRTKKPKTTESTEKKKAKEPKDCIWCYPKFPCANGKKACYNETQRMTPYHALNKYQLVHNARILLERHKLWHIASGGTLLGAVRNKGIIPHDNDLDFNFLFGHFNVTKAFLADLEKNGMGLNIHDFSDKKFKTKSWRKGSFFGARERGEMDDPGVRFYRIHFLNWGKYGRRPGAVDMFGLVKHGDKITYPKNFHPARLKTEWPASIAEEGGLVQWPFGSTTVPAPPREITEAFLDNEYPGEDWRNDASCGDPTHYKQGSTFHECFEVQDTKYAVTGRALPDGPLEDPL